MDTYRQAAGMISSRNTTLALIAAMAVAVLAFVLPSTTPVDAAGLRNCVDLTGRAVDRVGCYELVWVDDVQLRMTFSNTQFKGNVPADKLDNFYVVAPQTETPQGALPFPHDHVVRDVPRQNHGAYSVHLRGIFVLCSPEGIASGDCVPTMSSIEGLGTLPLATTVNGQMLTSVDVIESAADAGLVTLLDTGAVIVGTISGR